MPYPVDPATGHPQASGLLIPEVWSPRVLEKFYQFTCLEYITNTDYEGEITDMGDKVVIRTRPDIAISSYSKGQKLPVQRPTPSTVDLEIDKGKMWSFLVEQVDAAQSDYDYMQDWTADAAESMVEAIDLDVLTEVASSVSATNQGGTAGVSGAYNLGETGSALALTGTNILAKLAQCGSVLDEQNAPQTDRWMVVPSWFKALVYDSSIRDSLIQGNDQELLRKGHIGELGGFQIFVSNQLPITSDSGSTWDIPFGHRSAMTFASQLTNSRVIESESYFGYLVQGLNVYGFNMNKPEAAGLMYAQPSGLNA